MRYSKYLYLLKSVEFLVNLTAPNKKFLNITALFKWSQVYLIGNINIH